MAFWLYQSALMYGAVIGLLAIGFQLTHEVSGYMNLGHVVNLGVGMMFGFMVIQQTNIPPLLGVPFSFILTGGFNALVYLLFYRRMESKRYPETDSSNILGTEKHGHYLTVLSDLYRKSEGYLFVNERIPISQQGNRTFYVNKSSYLVECNFFDSVHIICFYFDY
jgi:hypothetical protein